MKEQILSCLYEIIKPWACKATNYTAYVHKNNVQYAKEYLKRKNFQWVEVKAMTSFPYI